MDFLTKFDTVILNSVYKLKNPLFDCVMPVITKTVNGGFIWILICVLCLVFAKTRKKGVVMAGALAINFIISNVFLKNIVARTRPFLYNDAVELLIKAPKDFSFPSGHTSASFAVSTVIFLFDKKLGILTYIFSFLIGFSRLYLYVHYPSDVFCGAVIGILSALLSMKVFENKYK